MKMTTDFMRQKNQQTWRLGDWNYQGLRKKKNEGESLNELVGHNQTDQYKHYGNYRRRERRKQDIV